MFLKTLKIHGFKSFPDRTVLEFPAGLTAVVGPNGSGKSNISDAIRWVLGEQSAKELRGGRMEDIIFSGTQTRKQMGYASVEIIFDNVSKTLGIDTDEVSIQRKYYRSGESEYKINGNAVLHREVHELLMDTGVGKDGYAVIGQGKIAEIISAKSTERRQIFEEAAGVSKYRYRREQTEKQLETAAENLVRLNDIIAEIEGRLLPLQNQSKKAHEFVKLSNEERELEVSILMENLEKYKLSLREISNKIMICKSDYDKQNEELLKTERENEDIFKEMNEASIKIEEIRSICKSLDDTIAKLESDKAVFKNDIFHKQSMVKEREIEKTLILTDEKTLEKAIEEKRGARDELFKAKEVLESKIEEAEDGLTKMVEISREKGIKLEDLGRNLFKNNEDIMSIGLEINKFESASVERKNREIKLENLVSEGKSAIIGLELAQNRLKEQEQTLTKTLSESKKKSDFLRSIGSGIQNQVNDCEKKHTELTLELHKSTERKNLLVDMENNMEDFAYSVKTIVKSSKKGEVQGVHGTVADLIKTGEKYALAVETALGFSIQNIVVDDENSAKQGIEYLRSRKAGRATFLPLTVIKGITLADNDFSNHEGFLGIASSLVETDEKYSGILASLLGRTVVCSNLESASALAKKNNYRTRIVTLDGQIINAGGSFTGGSGVRTAGILSRRNEIENTESINKEIQTKISENREAHEKAMKKFKETTQKLRGFIDSEKQLEEDLVKIHYEKISAKNKLSDSNQTFENAQKEQNENISFFAEAEKMLNEAREKEVLLKENGLEIERETEEISKYKIGFEDNRGELSDKIRDLKLSLLRIEKNTEMNDYTLEELLRKSSADEKKFAEIAEIITTLEEEVVFKEAQILKVDEKTQEAKKSIDENEAEIKKVFEKRNKLEASTSGTRQKERDIMAAREDISKENARLEELLKSTQMGTDEIVAKLWDEYELTVSSAGKEAQKLDDVKKAKISLKALKNQIRALGTVNLGAISEYGEVKERYAFLTTQAADVENSRLELLNLVGELTTTMAEMFTACFKEINAEFETIFEELFGGGSGYLELSDPENVLESGIEIHVEPPGKIIKSLKALSGGEQAFVAIAVYFAILKVRPAPFALLDEIEAALDDVNVTKFAQYLKTMSDKTQFIAISHRRGTMEEADLLYGVTMQENGVSKLLKLEFSEALETAQIN